MKQLLTLLTLGVAVTSFIHNFSRKAAASDAPTDPRVTRVLEILRGSVNATTEEQIRISEIPKFGYRKFPRRHFRRAFAPRT